MAAFHSSFQTFRLLPSPHSPAQQALFNKSHAQTSVTTAWGAMPSAHWKIFRNDNLLVGSSVCVLLVLHLSRKSGFQVVVACQHSPRITQVDSRARLPWWELALLAAHSTILDKVLNLLCPWFPNLWNRDGNSTCLTGLLPEVNVGQFLAS